MPVNRMRPIHPGELLREDMEELGLSSRQLAAALGIPDNRISQIVAGKRSVTADTALRLARFFGTTAEFWMNVQAAYDLRTTEIKDGGEIERTIAPRVVGREMPVG